jgi:hypothetical protein
VATRDLSAFFEDGALDYPGVPSKKHPDGKTYKVPSPDGKTGLWLNDLADSGMSAAVGRELTDGEKAKLNLNDEDDERDFFRTVLGCTKTCGAPDEGTGKPVPCGSAFDQMLDDGVEWMLIQRISKDAFLCFGMNQEYADASLELEGKAEALAAEAALVPNRADKRAAAKAPKPRSSASRAGSSSSPTGGRASTRSSQGTTRGSETSAARKTPAKKTA